MILCIHFFPLLLHLISAGTYYIIPLNPLNIPNITSLCTPFGTKSCAGTLAKPYDNLAVAFKTAIVLAGFFRDKNLTFNLITNVDGIFPLGSSATDYSTISPFETFEGNL